MNNNNKTKSSPYHSNTTGIPDNVRNIVLSATKNEWEKVTVHFKKLNRTELAFRFRENSTWLHLFCDQGAPKEIILDLIQHYGFNVNEVTALKLTPLAVAVMGPGQIETIKVILECGADPNLGDFYSASAIKVGVVNNVSINIIRLLLEYGGKLNSPTDKGYINLHGAVQYNASVEMVTFLLENNEDPNTQALDGTTPLHLGAYHKCCVEIMYALLEFGGNFTIKDADGKTSMDYAVENNNTELVQLFLNSPLPIKARTGMRMITSGEVDVCGFCHKSATTTKSTTGSTTTRLPKCKGCYNISYCDMICAKAHWPVHKVDCNKLHITTTTATTTTTTTSSSQQPSPSINRLSISTTESDSIVSVGE
jgi:ankyrin repeat protein